MDITPIQGNPRSLRNNVQETYPIDRERLLSEIPGQDLDPILNDGNGDQLLKEDIQYEPTSSNEVIFRK